MTARLGGSVGRRAMNALDDVKIVQTLLGRHSRWLIPLRRPDATGICDPLTIASIERFQLRAMRLINPDGVVWPNGSTIAALNKPAIDDAALAAHPAAAMSPSAGLKPVRGLVTFESEGVESPGSPYHSRVLHVPGGASGVTIGRGYDMGRKTSAKIQADLISAGVPAAEAKEIAKAAGLTGAPAEAFRKAHEDFSISLEAQLKLFEISYREEEAEVRRISDGASCRSTYGTVDWTKLHPGILDVFVDLKFRGDWSPGTRKFCQKYLVNNDLKGLAECMKKSANWPGVPPDRFKRRNDFLAKALAGG